MGRRKPQVVRRIASLEEHNAWVEARAEGAKSRLDKAVEEADEDRWDGGAGGGGGGAAQRKRARGWASSSDGSEEEQDLMLVDDDDDDDGLAALDDSDADDEAALLAEAAAEEEAEAAAAAAERARRRRRKARGDHKKARRKKKTRRRRRLRKAVEDDSEEESDASAAEDEALQVALESLQAQIKVGVPAPEEEEPGEEGGPGAGRRALRVQRTSFPVAWADWPKGATRRFASLLLRPHAFAPYRLRLSPPEDLMGSVWEGEARAALGLRKGAGGEEGGEEDEGVGLLMALCEAAPPLAYFEGVGEGEGVHVDLYLTRRALALARADNDPPAVSPHLRRIRRLLELCAAHGLPEVSAYYGGRGGAGGAAAGEGEAAGDGGHQPMAAGAAGAGVPRGPFDPADLYRCLEEYKAAHLLRRRHRRRQGQGLMGGWGGVEESKNGLGGGGKAEEEGGGEDGDEDGLEVPGLAVTLRPYQRDALRWMASRERGEPFFLPPAAADDAGDGPLPHGWLRLRVEPGETVYYNPYSVALSRTPPPAWSVDGIRGGILADEMGLGKTVEVLALVLSHRYQPGPGEEAEEDEDEAEAAAAAMDEQSTTTGTTRTSSPQQLQGSPAANGVEEAAAACPCGLPHQQGRKGQQHQRWICCDACGQWVHLECAGLPDQAAADALDRYTCEVCHGLRRFRRPRRARATLIVTPQLICEQWEEELAQRVRAGDSLRVAIYRGVAETRPEQRAALLNPDRLGNDFDVVLTTFDVLGKDLAHTDSAFVPREGEAGRSLRRRKKYRVTPSPLASVVWWRVCLDEAQMVESSTAAAARMALRLRTVHRWCVSGTPIWKGQLDDLYGLLVFLQVAPYDHRPWWRHAIELPHEKGDPEAASRLHALLSNLMWRTSKKSVKDQLALPPQTEVVRRLRFSRVERHFYQLQHAECEKEVQAAVHRIRLARARGGQAAGEKGRGAMGAAALEKCAAPLLRLRQACCHPQIGAGGLGARGAGGGGGGGAVGDRPMTMEEVHARLVEDCKLKCEESQRLLLMQLSGLGAVARIQAQIAAETTVAAAASAAAATSTAQALTRDRFLAEAARFYERGILVSEANRRPVPMRGAEDLRGAPRFRGGMVGVEGGLAAVGDGVGGGGGGDHHCLSLRWEAAAGAAGPVDVEAAARGSTWAPSAESPLWASVTFDTARKVMGLRFWPLPSPDPCAANAATPAALPGRCRVMACASPDGSVFVEVASFDLAKLAPEGDLATGARSILGFNIFGARTWKLEVLSLLPTTVPAGPGKGPAPATVVVGARVECLAAEVEVDPLQLLHLTTNLREVLLDMVGGGEKGAEAASSSSLAAAGEEGEGREEEGQEANGGGDPHTVVMRYEEVKALPVAHRLTWLAERTAAVRRRESNLARLVHRANRQYYLGAERAVEDLLEEVRAIAARAGRKGMTWWEWTLGQLGMHTEALDSSGELLRRLQISPYRSDFPAFRDYHGLLVALQGRVKELMDLRKDLNRRLKALSDDPSEAEVRANSVCGVCKKDWGKRGPTCGLCRLEGFVTGYQNKLYSFRRQGNSQRAGMTARSGADAGDEVLQLRPGGERLEVWKGHVTLAAFSDPSEAHRILYMVLVGWLRQQASRRKDDPAWQAAAEEAQCEVRIRELLEKERRTGQRFWDSHYDLLSKIDEVGCAAVRLELAREDEDPRHMAPDRRKVVVFRQEVPLRREELAREVAAYEGELTQHKKQLRYLKHIAEEQGSKGAAANHHNHHGGPPSPHPAAAASSSGAAAAAGGDGGGGVEEDCPVCLESVGGRPVMVVPCGHHICEECFKHMMGGNRSKGRCPTCRENFLRKDARKAEALAADDDRRRRHRPGGLSPRGEGSDEEAEEEEGGEEGDEQLDVSDVRGSWGTKVTALVAEVLRLPPDDKCLVFSEWDEMLDIIEHALRENAVAFVRLKGERTAGKARREFREQAGVRCMLLNLKSGAKGLTLVEANHVFLLEPVFNAANEAQAINRVHRIGQTRPTKIHRFIVRGTVEERVERMRLRRLAAAGGEDSVLNSAVKGSGGGGKGKGRGGQGNELSVDEMEALFGGGEGEGKKNEGKKGAEGEGKGKEGKGKGKAPRRRGVWEELAQEEGSPAKALDLEGEGEGEGEEEGGGGDAEVVEVVDCEDESNDDEKEEGEGGDGAGRRLGGGGAGAASAAEDLLGAGRRRQKSRKG